MSGNKSLHKRRMMSYFIEATNKLMEEEGLDALTVRKIADLAGYNSATLYNYFKNIDHLIFFASMKYLKNYVMSLPDYIKDAENTLEKFWRIWECFCHHSYSEPKIYQAIFFTKFNSQYKDAITEYYQIFPEELGEQPKELLKMLSRQNIYERNLSSLQNCVKEGFFKKEDIAEINEMTLLIYQGMLSRILSGQVNYLATEATAKTLRYIKQATGAYQLIPISNLNK